jgi:hypothetical protein
MASRITGKADQHLLYNADTVNNNNQHEEEIYKNINSKIIF